MQFKNVWNGSTFLFNDRPMRKISNAISVDLLNGKDNILSLKDEVKPIKEKILLRNFNLQS